MRELLASSAASTDGYTIFWAFIIFNRHLQYSAPPSVDSPRDPLGLGEPKFMPDATPFTDPWGRPQDDGPALRVSFAREFVERLLRSDPDAALRARIREHVYSGTRGGAQGGRQPMADADLAMLERCAFRNTSFDIWEETRGLHYYTVAAQTRAFRDAAWLARELAHDSDAEQRYLGLAAQGESLLAGQQFFDARGGYIRATIAHHGNAKSGLDVAVVLAACHSRLEQDMGETQMARLEQTVDSLYRAFSDLYPINQDKSLAPGIGRYPEDTYYGGNPWFLATLAMAQHMYERAAAASASGACGAEPCARSCAGGACGRSAEELLSAGDKFVMRARRHMDSSGEIDEQFDAHTGYMRSARDLTWSHAALLAAARARRGAVTRAGRDLM